MAISGTIRNKAYMAARRCCCLIGRICGQNIVKQVWGIYLQKSTQHTTTAAFAPMWRGLCNPAPFLNCPSLFIFALLLSITGRITGLTFFTTLDFYEATRPQHKHCMLLMKLNSKSLLEWEHHYCFMMVCSSFFFSESNRICDFSLPGLVHAWPFESLRPPDKGA